ncbi:hypothetical protein HDU85_003944 [Gaertneriomyces sp. JEL0708]|nr:hypothetical protein HDU85_003944 [Gaertneriomyces sp. JEL0708]
MKYPRIPGTVPVPHAVAPLPAPEDAMPPELASPATLPVRGGKSIFAYWHSGIHSLPPYLLRNVMGWYRRFSPLGWSIYVVDSVPNSPLNVSRFIDTSSRLVVPLALTNGTLDGSYASQHTSDLIRYPLLLKYGGVYLDVGILQFGDLDWLWEQHLANPASPYDFAGFTMGNPPEGISIVNFALMSIPDCPLILRAHKILLKLWEGKTNTTGAHQHPLVSHVPLLRVPAEVAVAEEGKEKMAIDDESMTDYAIQIQAMGSAERWLDESGDWNGPEYVRNKCWLYSMIDMAYVNEQMTNWNSKRQFDLFSLNLPGPCEQESEEQKLAREIVEKSISMSWCLKLAHGFSAKLFGAPTLGMLWRANDGSDCREGTYAGWLRWALVNLTQVTSAKPLDIPAYEPTMVSSFESLGL